MQWLDTSVDDISSADVSNHNLQTIVYPSNRRCIVVLVALIAVCIALALGLVAKYVLDVLGLENYRGGNFAVSWLEFGGVSAVMSALIIPVVLVVGNSLSIDNIITYQQFVNGVETVAGTHVTTCEAGHSGRSKSAGYSNCEYAHITGHYTWQEDHTYETCTTDANGNRSCTTHHYTTTEHGDIYTPFATKEYNYFIDASAGKGGDFPRYTFSTTYVADDAKRYSADVAIPRDVPRGAPADWLDAKRRLEAGNPRPVTMISSYENYILASDDKILKESEVSIQRYKKAGLLPDLATNINSDPMLGDAKRQADKVMFVGVDSIDKRSMQNAVMQFNAALGMKLQGDLHVVFVNSDTVNANQAEDYTSAVKAYWQSPAFGKRAIAKNGIILVIGVKDSSVSWARATTGMPFGNETMEQWVQDWLPGKSVTPASLFGSPRTVIKPGVTADTFTSDDLKVTLSTPRGALEEIMFEKAPFNRARMNCSDKTCVGYSHLLDKIEPTASQKTWMVVVTAIVALLLWVLVGYTSFLDALMPSRRRDTHRSYYTSETDRYSDLIRQSITSQPGFTRRKRSSK